MKRLSIYSILALVVLTAACGKDNYDAPASFLEGRLVYNGEPIQVEKDQVRVQLWEPGWGKLAAMDVAIAQDGSFSALLFDGNYKLTFPAGDGPYIAPETNGVKDTVYIGMAGDKSLDIEVMPYYLVRNAQFSVSGSMVQSTCSVEQIVTGTDAKEVESVTLYISTTNVFATGTRAMVATMDSAVDASTDLGNLSMEVEVPELVPAQSYVFARVGVKIAGVEDRIFSAVQKINL